MSSAKPKVINASVFCSTKSFISLAREKVKFEVIKLFSSSDVPMVLPFTYYVPNYAYNQDLAVDIKQSNFFK